MATEMIKHAKGVLRCIGLAVKLPISFLNIISCGDTMFIVVCHSGSDVKYWSE